MAKWRFLDIKQEVTHPLDWPFTLFSANLMSVTSFTPSLRAMHVRSLSDIHWTRFRQTHKKNDRRGDGYLIKRTTIVEADIELTDRNRFI